MQLGQKPGNLPVLDCLATLDVELLVKRVPQRWGERAMCSVVLGNLP